MTSLAAVNFFVRKKPNPPRIEIVPSLPDERNNQKWIGNTLVDTGFFSGATAITFIKYVLACSDTFLFLKEYIEKEYFESTRVYLTKYFFSNSSVIDEKKMISRDMMFKRLRNLVRELPSSWIPQPSSEASRPGEKE